MANGSLAGLKAVLDALTGDIDFEDADPEDLEVLTAAVRNFCSRDEGILVEVTPFLWKYYALETEAFSVGQRSAYGIPLLDPSTHNVWDEVTFRFPPAVTTGRHPLQPAQSYLSFEGEVSWEPEHGLQLVFEDGLRVCKVGPYDGHNTNAHAYADPSLLGVVVS